VVEADDVCSHPVTAAQLRMYPPGQRAAQPVPLSVTVCPRSSTMRVLPVRPGTEIPNYTTS
jgi:hypothetical protein